MAPDSISPILRFIPEAAQFLVLRLVHIDALNGPVVALAGLIVFAQMPLGRLGVWRRGSCFTFLDFVSGNRTAVPDFRGPVVAGRGQPPAVRGLITLRATLRCTG